MTPDGITGNSVMIVLDVVYHVILASKLLDDSMSVNVIPIPHSKNCDHNHGERCEVATLSPL
jgi:hypothetical protein